MQIFLNGQSIEVDENTTLSDLFAQKNIPLDGSAASVDGVVIPKATFSEYILKEGMNLDIFSLVAGG